ncbi:hypothetical protein KIOSHI_33 [Bacillus phage Kioshi]|nr:hypothetical protein KIOSHI_33 [Bacillus phage Kioshi]
MDYYKDVLPKLKEGKKFRRPYWDKNVFLYYIPGHEISSGLKYGYGEYQGEPTFQGTVVMRTAINTLELGYRPDCMDKEATDWEEIK